MRRTAVVTDSTARLGGAPVPHPGTPWSDDAAVATVELDVLVDGDPVRETDLPVELLLQCVGAGQRATTSRPSPEGFTAAYQQVAAHGASAAVSVHLSGALSGTVDAARTAAAGAPLRVAVVDTRTVGGAHAAAVRAAAAAASAGTDVRRTAALAEAVAGASATWVSPATAAHLLAGGRGPQALAAVAQLARPLLELVDGRLAPAERVRSTGRLVERLVQLADDHLAALARGSVGRGPGVGLSQAARDDSAAAGVQLGGAACVVQHVGALEAADHLASRLVEQTGGGRDATGLGAAAWAAALPSGARSPSGPLVLVRELGPVLASHVGPGALGVAVVPWARRPHSPR